MNIFLRAIFLSLIFTCFQTVLSVSKCPAGQAFYNGICGLCPSDAKVTKDSKCICNAPKSTIGNAVVAAANTTYFKCVPKK